MQWENYHHLKLWFDNREKYVMKLGFTEVTENGYIMNNQHLMTLNVDETYPSFD